MVQKALLNSAPGGLGIPNGASPEGGGRHPPPPGPPQVTPRGQKVTKISVSWWSPVCQNITMPGPETALYGVKHHSGVVQWPSLAPGHPGFALGSFSSRS